MYFKGTLLGATFSAMFPDRVGRVVLDGVVDADLYVSPIWGDSIEETDVIFNKFHTYCYEAGSRCLIARPGDKSAQDIQDRVEGIIAKIQKQSLVGYSEYFHTPSVITWNQLKYLIFAFLYGPTGSYPVLASIFDLLERDMEAQVHWYLAQPHEVIDFKPFCLPELPTSFNPGDATYAIMCSDKRYPVSGACDVTRITS
jgi:hypothetical protein